jgi:catechol 2,3-dioxygenase-like lactoylglutathione lyase family enzyme
MSTTLVHDERPVDPAARAVPTRLEAVVVPVADFDRALRFYTGLGWRLDADVDDHQGYRLAQVTPTGSQASVIFGTQVTAARPGSLDGLLLAVDDIAAARADLLARGVEVSEAFHDAGGGLGGGFHVGDAGRASGPDPLGRSYPTYASFVDSEGNRWLLQEITSRLPGRVDPTPADEVAGLAELLRETSQHHDAFEKAAPAHDWWDWYAAYAQARQQGSTADEAVSAAARYMREVKQVSARP